MSNNLAFAVLVGCLTAGTMLFLVEKSIVEKVGSRYDQTVASQPLVGKILSAEGSISVRNFGSRENLTVKNESDLHHLDSLILESKATALFSVGGYELKVVGPAQFIFEIWNFSQPNSPVVIHVLTGELAVEKEGTLGQLYTLENGEMRDPKGSLKSKVTTLHISSSVMSDSKNLKEISRVANPEIDKNFVGGVPTNEFLDSEIAKQSESFQRCQTNALREHGQIRGQVMVGLSISNQGRVDEARVLSSTIENEGLLNCVIEVFKRVKLAPFSGATIVRSYPLNFE